MPGPLLGIPDSIGQLPMHHPPLRGRRLVVHRGSHQRMAEPHRPVAGVDHSGPLRPGEVALDWAAPGLLQLLHARRRHRGREEQHPPSALGQVFQAPAEQITEALRHREVPDVGNPAAIDPRSRELEAEERIAPRRLVHPHECRPRERDAEPSVHELVRRAQRHRRDREPSYRKVLEEQVGQPVPTPGDDNRDRLGVEASQREPECLPGRYVEPLRIIDGDHGRRCASELAKDTQQRDGNGPLTNGCVGRRAHQGSIERPSLGLRQLGCGLVHPRAQKVDQAREADPGLALGGLAGKYPIPTLVGRTYGLAPQPGLADAGLSLDEQSGRMTAGRVQERADRREFRIAPDRALRGSHDTVDCGRPERARATALRTGPSGAATTPSPSECLAATSRYFRRRCDR